MEIQKGPGVSTPTFPDWPNVGRGFMVGNKNRKFHEAMLFGGADIGRVGPLDSHDARKQHDKQQK